MDPKTNPIPKHVSRLSAALDEEGDLDVVRDIGATDPMYAYAPEMYFAAGQAALRCIRLAMLAADLQRVSRVLDFGCALGRVLRSLRAGFPEATITACEIRKHDVEWCQKTFGERNVVGVLSAWEPEQVRLDGQFDVIWCGSILSHIDKDRWTRFLKLFESNLAPGGVLVFTVYGPYIAELVRAGKSLLNLTPEQAAKVIRDYDETGFGFDVTREDGDAIVSRSWVCQQLESVPSLELVGFAERAWLWQDVVACAKTRDQD
jgi:SAM-dependent methyltransferase